MRSAIFFLLALAFSANCVSGQRASAKSISKAEFDKAFTVNGYSTPKSSYYKHFRAGLKTGGITRKLEAAMFLAQIMHESGGLKYRREHGCSGPNGCPGKYPTSNDWNPECTSNPVQGVSYYGRGWMQLTWCSNYVKFSRDIGRGDEYKRNPDAIAKSDKLSWQASFWYWKAVVRQEVGPNNVQFGKTTKAINGKIECQGGNATAQKRFKMYATIYRAWGLAGNPDPAGCP